MGGHRKIHMTIPMRNQKKFMKPCFDEDELLNLCSDTIEICHEERADEKKLVRLDGVKVRQSTVIIMLLS